MVHAESISKALWDKLREHLRKIVGLWASRINSSKNVSAILLK
jgi:hypothetical protein